MKLKVALNELLIYNKNFVFRKLEFNMICYAYSNESPFKYYTSVLEGVRSEAMLILHF